MLLQSTIVGQVQHTSQPKKNTPRPRPTSTRNSTSRKQMSWWKNPVGPNLDLCTRAGDGANLLFFCWGPITCWLHRCLDAACFGGWLISITCLVLVLVEAECATKICWWQGGLYAGVRRVKECRFRPNTLAAEAPETPAEPFQLRDCLVLVVSCLVHLLLAWCLVCMNHCVTRVTLCFFFLVRCFFPPWSSLTRTVLLVSLQAAWVF